MCIIYFCPFPSLVHFAISLNVTILAVLMLKIVYVKDVTFLVTN